MNRAFSLIEVLVATVVLAIATTALILAFSGSIKLKDATDEEVIALNAVEQKIAEIRQEADVSFGQVFTYASSFSVDGLLVRDGDYEAGSVAIVLKEDLSSYYGGGSVPEWGIGGSHRLDLDEDGVLDEVFQTSNPDQANYVSDIRIVPIVVRVRWKARSGGLGELTRHILIADTSRIGG